MHFSPARCCSALAQFLGRVERGRERRESERRERRERRERAGAPLPPKEAPCVSRFVKGREAAATAAAVCAEIAVRRRPSQSQGHIGDSARVFRRSLSDREGRGGGA